MTDLSIPDTIRNAFSPEQVALETQLAAIKACCGASTFSSERATEAWNNALEKFALSQGNPTTVVLDNRNEGSITSWSVADLTRDSVNRDHPWASTFALAKSQVDQIEAEYTNKKKTDIWEPFRVRAVEAAKKHRLNAIEALLCSQLLFPKDGDVERAAFTIVNLVLSMPQNLVFLTPNAEPKTGQMDESA